MVSNQEFFEAVFSLGFNFRGDNPDLNEVMKDAIQNDLNQVQFIVAGPGSGKTATMVLRTLYLIFVEEINPKSIILTTFTRQAAKELKSRIQSFGIQIQNWLNENAEYQILYDFNAIEVGTLDSLVQNWLSQAQASSGINAAVIDQYGAKLLMTRIFLRRPEGERERIGEFLRYLEIPEGQQIPGANRFNNSVSRNIDRLLTLSNRFIEDMVDPEDYNPQNPEVLFGRDLAIDLLQSYWDDLRNRNLFEYSTLALFFAYTIGVEDIPEDLLNQVFTENDLEIDVNYDTIFENFKILFVDEYQDTNYLQERIYFKIFDIIREIQDQNEMTVVGDDDQSLYRFRGSTVELFTEFPQRISESTGISLDQIITHYLMRNYRSTRNIVDFVNRYVGLIPEFQPLRVEDKESIIYSSDIQYNPPIILVNGEDPDEIAQKIMSLLLEFSNDGIDLDNQDDPYQFDEDGGFGDVAILLNSPNEIRASSGNLLLPFYLRQQFNTNGIGIFNPNGSSINQNQNISQLLGYILHILDPELDICDDIRLPQDIRDRIRNWYNIAEQFIDQIDDDDQMAYLDNFMNRRFRDATPWNRVIRFSLSNLIYENLVYFSYFQTDQEGMVYLAALREMLNQISIINPNGQVLTYDPDDQERWEWSVRSLIWSFFVPIASEVIEIDEELLESMPRNRPVVRSIHQSKGLEFPIVIVDVGSEITRNAPYWRPWYYPISGNSNVWINQKVRENSAIGGLVTDPIQTAFADVIRKFFVAYSRAASILVLVGTDKVFGDLHGQDPNNPIRIAQLGWYQPETNIHNDLREDLFDGIPIWRI